MERENAILKQENTLLKTQNDEINKKNQEQKVEIGKNNISEESKNEIYPLLDIDLNNLNAKQNITLKKLL